MKTFDDEYQLPTVALDKTEHCSICGKDGCTMACFSCGQPVCYSAENYFADTDCGSWILDTWHEAHPDENEYYCDKCLKGNDDE